MAYRTAVVVSLFLFAASLLLAKDFWAEPFEKWNREQVLRMLSDSPWAQSETFTGVTLGINSGLQGEKELYYRFTSRFFSALPVRQAYVRMARLMNNYDNMAPEQRQEFDTRFKRALDLDVADRVIVAIDYATNDPEVERDLRSFFELAKKDTLKQQVYLISKKLGRVELLDYFPPSADGTGAKFIFPRSVSGQPVFGAQDKEIRFDFTPPQIHNASLRVLLSFKSAKMIYQGVLSF